MKRVVAILSLGVIIIDLVVVLISDYEARG
jgi:hypothetical protein